MRSGTFWVCFLLWVTGISFAQPYTIHIQSPWSADSSLADTPHTLSVSSQQRELQIIP
jgi:hypothetical protein